MSNPVESGHPCLGCSEPGFWDQGSFYTPLPTASPPEVAGNSSADRGAAVFDSNCIRCHDAGPRSLKTSPDDVSALLRDGKIRSHRFTLDDADTQALVNFLKQIR